MRSFNRIARKSWPAALALVTTVLAGNSHAIYLIIPLDDADNYAECVIRQIKPDVGALEIRTIEGDCRTEFPQPSRRGLFGPSDVQKCYKKHEQRAAHRQAAQAIYGACQDYFRKP